MLLSLKGQFLKIFSLLILCSCLSFLKRTEAADGGITSDKGMHFGVAAVSHMTCSVITESLTNSKWGSKIGCWMIVNAAGVLKEITDPMHQGTRDVNDVYANMAGSGFSFATLSIAF